MVVALLTADKSDFLKSFAFWPDKSLVDITPFAYLIFLLWLVGRGGGVISIDRQLLAWWIRTQVPSASKPSAPPADPVN